MFSLFELKNLFPTKLHAVIFVGYMGLFINQGLLVTATKGRDNNYPYNPTTLVLFSEFLKFVAASGFHIKDVGVKSCMNDFLNNVNVFFLYLIPAFLYCLYNNLAFVNLRSYDPTTYFLLLQFRVVLTGIIFQVLFSKKLSVTQWFSLLLLTLGCIVKQLNVSNSITISFNLSLLLILLQVFCSCFAGVYNEYLLKGKGDAVPFMLQNIFMYVNSIACNIALLTYNGDIGNVLQAQNVHAVLEPKAVAIIINNAAIGIVTAMFLKSLNSILKTFASALELMFTAVLSWIIFGLPISLTTVVAIAIVSIATILYAKNPVVNTVPQQPTGVSAKV